MTIGHPAVGTDVAGYRIEHLLGRGGMGTVYRAFDVRLGRPVALKLLTPGASGSDGAPERLLHESRLAARLDHPNVIPIYEAGQRDGRLFIAMRYVAGGDLKVQLYRALHGVWGQDGPGVPEHEPTPLLMENQAIVAARR